MSVVRQLLAQNFTILKVLTMRKLSIFAFASALILWGISLYLKSEKANMANYNVSRTQKSKSANFEESTSLLNQSKRRELDKIGTVINEENVQIDPDTKEQIKVAKKVFDSKQNLKDKQILLEQSFADQSGSLKDTKRIQDEIVNIKNKLKLELTNSERWDPKFTYYLMIQENYTYAEINQIKSLSENGLSSDEINYITELIKEDSFVDKIKGFKNQTDTSRTIASLKKKPKEKDDFIDDPLEGASLESKLIEMNYNQEEKEEMVYGNAQN